MQVFARSPRHPINRPISQSNYPITQLSNFPIQVSLWLS